MMFITLINLLYDRDLLKRTVSDLLVDLQKRFLYSEIFKVQTHGDKSTLPDENWTRIDIYNSWKTISTRGVLKEISRTCKLVILRETVQSRCYNILNSLSNVIISQRCSNVKITKPAEYCFIISLPSEQRRVLLQFISKIHFTPNLGICIT